MSLNDAELLRIRLSNLLDPHETWVSLQERSVLQSQSPAPRHTHRQLPTTDARPGVHMCTQAHTIYSWRRSMPEQGLVPMWPRTPHCTLRPGTSPHLWILYQPLLEPDQALPARHGWDQDHVWKGLLARFFTAFPCSQRQDRIQAGLSAQRSCFGP